MNRRVNEVVETIQAAIIGPNHPLYPRIFPWIEWVNNFPPRITGGDRLVQWGVTIKEGPMKGNYEFVLVGDRRVLEKK